MSLLGDYEDALGGGMMDLSRRNIWGGTLGRKHLEFEMAHRLHSLRVAQVSDRLSPIGAAISSCQVVSDWKQLHGISS